MALPASADIVLEARAGDGTVVESYPVTTATVVSFSETGVVVANGEAQATMPFGAFQTLGFGSGSVGIGKVEAVSTRLFVTPNPVRSAMAVAGAESLDATLNIFDTSGRRVVSRSNYNGETIDVSSLAPGLYLAQIDNQTIKFIKK